MRLSRLPFLAAMFIPSIACAAENFMSSGVPYVSPTGSQTREVEAQQQEQIIRYQEPDAQVEPNAQDMVTPPDDMQQYLLDQQNKFNEKQQLTNEQQRNYSAAMANYKAELDKRNIDPAQASSMLPPPQNSYPPTAGSPYYDPSKDYSPDSHYLPHDATNAR